MPAKPVKDTKTPAKEKVTDNDGKLEIDIKTFDINTINYESEANCQKYLSCINEQYLNVRAKIRTLNDELDEIVTVLKNIQTNYAKIHQIKLEEEEDLGDNDVVDNDEDDTKNNEDSNDDENDELEELEPVVESKPASKTVKTTVKQKLSTVAPKTPVKKEVKKDVDNDEAEEKKPVKKVVPVKASVPAKESSNAPIKKKVSTHPVKKAEDSEDTQKKVDKKKK
jgi:hypothetical protein